MRFGALVCAGVACLACCPDGDLKESPSPCLLEAGALPEPDSGTPADGLAASRKNCLFVKGDFTSKTIGTGSDETKLPGDSLPIENVVVLMMENRSFDHYLSELGPPWDVATNETNPDRLGNEVARLHETNYAIPKDPNHEWEGVHLQYNGGAMDGFVVTNPPDGRRTMNYYDGNDLPLFYWLAHTFGSSDRYFSSLLGPTWPNRYFFLAATARGRTTTPEENVLGAEVPELGVDSILDQLGSDARIYSQLSFPLTNVMLPADVDFPFSDIEAFEAAAKAGTLPAFSFVEPEFHYEDDHPPADIRNGQRFVRRILEAIAEKNTWSKVVLFITYDEHGGFYDHVPPPAACVPDDMHPATHEFDRYGVRVPLFVISPYVKNGAVSHMVTDHTSITRFIAHRFGLPALTRRDANAWPLLDLFDFSKQSFPSFPSDMPQAEPTKP